MQIFYFDISWEGGGGVLIFRLIAWGGSENLYGPWGGGDIKKRAAEKKNPLPPPCSIHNECSLTLLKVNNNHFICW